MKLNSKKSSQRIKQSGATLVEYSAMPLTLAVVVTSGASLIGEGVSYSFSKVNESISGPAELLMSPVMTSSGGGFLGITGGGSDGTICVSNDCGSNGEIGKNGGNHENQTIRH